MSTGDSSDSDSSHDGELGKLFYDIQLIKHSCWLILETKVIFPLMLYSKKWLVSSLLPELDQHTISSDSEDESTVGT